MHKRKSNLGSEQHGSEQMQMIHDNSIWYVYYHTLKSVDFVKYKEVL